MPSEELRPCRGGCGRMVPDADAICERPECIRRVLMEAIVPLKRTLWKPFAEQKGRLIEGYHRIVMSRQRVA